MVLIALLISPLLTFFLLLAYGSRWSYRTISYVGVLGIALSAVLAIFLLDNCLSSGEHSALLWRVLNPDLMGNLFLDAILYVDTLSSMMTLLVSWIALLIALYSIEYMAQNENAARFFALINLFVFFMLLLLLAGDLWLLFLGFEGVSLCSFLLIGFYFNKPQALKAAFKAFITTAFGDLFLLLALVLCLQTFDIIDLQKIFAATADGSVDPKRASMISLLFLLAATGKSAQAPLTIWLADAMWGPTPVSALIHAATMVTSGVYLLARLSPLLELCVDIKALVLMIGAFTMIMAALVALIENDLKRVLAYSTMSQVGLMFMAIGVGGYGASIIHLMAHAFFKALLFLCAGTIGRSVGSYDMANMGDLRSDLKKTLGLFLIAAASLIGLPITAGFFSKETILSLMKHESTSIYFIGLAGVFLTGLYTTRMVVTVFFGAKREHRALSENFNPITFLSMVVLAILSLGFGLIGPEVSKALTLAIKGSHVTLYRGLHGWESVAIALLSITIYLFYDRSIKQKLVFTISDGTLRILRGDLGIYWLYRALLIDPYLTLTASLRSDPVERGIRLLSVTASRILSSLSLLHRPSLIYQLWFYILTGTAIITAMVLR